MTEYHYFTWDGYQTRPEWLNEEGREEENDQ